MSRNEASRSKTILAIPNDDLVKLLRLALSGHQDGLEKAARRLVSSDASDGLQAGLVIRQAQDQGQRLGGPFRSETLASVPVDIDSRAELLRSEYPVSIENLPIWSGSIELALKQVVQERMRAGEVHSAGLSPTRTALFYGPPGCGKTLAARWIAQQLESRSSYRPRLCDEQFPRAHGQQYP